VSCIDLSVQLLSRAVINMLILLCANKHGWMDGFDVECPRNGKREREILVTTEY